MLKFVRKLKEAQTADESVTLIYDQRVRTRQRVNLDGGAEAGLYLERGTVLRDGDVLISEDGITVRVAAAQELVSTARCDNEMLLARACYHLGNRHIPLQIEAGWIRYQHDHVLDQMLMGLGLNVVVEQAPFEPEPGAYAGKGHSHSGGDDHHHH